MALALLGLLSDGRAVTATTLTQTANLAEVDVVARVSTFNTPANELVQRLAAKDLATAIVTTPGGCLVGVFGRADAQARLSHPGIP